MTASNPLAERRLKGQADGRGDLQLQPLRESLLFSNRTSFGPRPAVSISPWVSFAYGVLFYYFPSSWKNLEASKHV